MTNGLNINEVKIKNIVEEEFRVLINASARTRRNSLAKKIFVNICNSKENTPHLVLARSINRTESLARVYIWKHKDISFDKELNKYYNKCLNKYECS